MKMYIIVIFALLFALWGTAGISIAQNDCDCNECGVVNTCNTCNYEAQNDCNVCYEAPRDCNVCYEYPRECNACYEPCGYEACPVEVEQPSMNFLTNPTPAYPVISPPSFGTPSSIPLMPNM